MGYSTEKIATLVDLVARKKLVLPEMQRRYVWMSSQVRDLFDSLYRGYPVGSVLVWERPVEHVEGRELDVGERNRAYMFLYMADTDGVVGIAAERVALGRRWRWWR